MAEGGPREDFHGKKKAGVPLGGHSPLISCSSRMISAKVFVAIHEKIRMALTNTRVTVAHSARSPHDSASGGSLLILEHSLELALHLGLQAIGAILRDVELLRDGLDAVPLPFFGEL